MLTEQVIRNEGIRGPRLVTIQLFPIPPPLPKIEEARKVERSEPQRRVSSAGTPSTNMLPGLVSRDIIAERLREAIESLRSEVDQPRIIWTEEKRELPSHGAGVKELPKRLPVPEPLPMPPFERRIPEIWREGVKELSRHEEVAKAVRAIKDDRPRDFIKPFLADIPPGTLVEMFKSNIEERLREPMGPLRREVIEKAVEAVQVNLPKEAAWSPPSTNMLPGLVSRDIIAERLREVIEPLRRGEEVAKLVSNRGNLDEDEVLRRVEEQRRREGELWEQLDRWKSTQVPRGWIWLPRLVELPGPPFAIPPWRWALPKPIELLSTERRREVPA